jgi:hypothetical protein
MQGLLPMAADLDQIRGRSAACDQFQTKKRMMALSAYTWPSDSKYWPVYDEITPPAFRSDRADRSSFSNHRWAPLFDWLTIRELTDFDLHYGVRRE